MRLAWHFKRAGVAFVSCAWLLAAVVVIACLRLASYNSLIVVRSDKMYYVNLA